MKRHLPIALLTLFLTSCGNDCTVPPPPTPPTNFYCAPAVNEPFVEMTVLDKFLESVKNQLPDTIVGGTPSADRRATMFLASVGIGSCTAVVMGPHTMLTAAHCLSKHPLTDPVPVLRAYPDATVNSFYVATDHLLHPNYDPDGGNKKADLMLLYFDEVLPPPYVRTIYSKDSASECEDMIAQGWGQTEASPEPCLNGKNKCLRESKYMVEMVALEGRTLISKQRTEGGICFGDSGGPLYAVVDGELQLSGITSWTQTNDCKVRSGHVNVHHYKDWIDNNFEGPAE